MGKNYKILAQASPAATTETNLYTISSNTNVSISSISICNRGSTNATYRIAMRPNGEALESKHYIAYDSTISGNDTIFLTAGLTVDSSDIVTVYSSSASVSFGIFGVEIV